jgi:hypothetical protein
MHPKEDFEILKHPIHIIGLDVDGAIGKMVAMRLAKEDEEEGSQCGVE